MPHLFTVELRGQRIGVCVRHHAVNLILCDRFITWRITLEEWETILASARDRGIETEQWFFTTLVPLDSNLTRAQTIEGIHTNLKVLSNLLATAAHRAREARDLVAHPNVDGAMGALAGLAIELQDAHALYTAVIALHRTIQSTAQQQER